MKKKLLLLILAILAPIILLTSCGNHEHDFELEDKDEISHFYECDCGWVQSELHIYEVVKVIEEATATKPGKYKVECKVCGYKTKIEQELAHICSFNQQYITDSQKHWHECVCGIKTNLEEHKFYDSKIVEQPTEYENGLCEYSCSVCGFVKTEVLEKLAHTHSYGTWEVEKNPTEDASGLLVSYCSCDDKKQMEIPALKEENVGEVYQYVVVQNPECDKVGLVQYIYTIGVQQFEFEVKLSTTEHLYIKHVKYNNEKHESTCDCGKLIYQEHNIETWTVKEESTCNIEGVEVGVCVDCGAELQRSIEKLAHKVANINALKPTCLNEGNEAGTYCENCNEIITGGKTLEKIDHKYENGVCTMCNKKQIVKVNYYDGTEIIKVVECEYGTLFEDYEVEEYPNYIEGWYSKDGKTKYDKTYVVKSNLDVYAKWDKIIEISTAEEWKLISENPTSNFIITKDISFSGATLTPIAKFSGNIDGNGHSLSYFTLKTTSINGNYAMFKVNEGTISNLALTDFVVSYDVDVECPVYAGIIAGTNNGIISNIEIIEPSVNVDVYTNYHEQTHNIGFIAAINNKTIENCSFSATVTLNTSYYIYSYWGEYNKTQVQNIGSLVGYNTGDIIGCESNLVLDIHSHFHADPTGVAHTRVGHLRNRLGGLVGINDKGNITKSYINATINYTSRTDSSISHHYLVMGGLVGYNSEGVIDQCYSTGSMNGGTNKAISVGGLVGENNNNGIIASSYSTVKYNSKNTSIGSGSSFGGLVGYNNASIKTSYSTGEVVSLISANVGGLVGKNGNAGVIVKSFAYTSIDAVSGYVGQLVAVSTGVVDKGYYTQAPVYNPGKSSEASLNSSSVVSSYSINDMINEKFLKDSLSWDESWFINGLNLPILSWEIEENKVHEFEERVIIESTCTEGGLKILVCEHCETILILEKEAALGHENPVEYNKENWKLPTHTEDGYEIYTCTREGFDSHTFMVTLEATGHPLPEDLSCKNFVYDEDNHSYYYLCDCGSVENPVKIYVSSDIIIHTHESVQMESPECGTLLSDVSVLLQINDDSQHNSVIIDMVKDDDYDGEGIRYSSPTSDEYILMVNGKGSFLLNYTNGTEVEVYEGTFDYVIENDVIVISNISDSKLFILITNILINEQIGHLSGEKCSDCNQTISGCDIIEPHYYVLSHTITEATCYQEGIEIYKCLLCKHVNLKKVDKTAHKYNANSLKCLNEGCNEEQYQIDDSYIAISSEEQLSMISKNSSGKFYLANDIELTGKITLPLCENFTGIFHGNGKTISNVTLKYNGNASINSGLFGTISTTTKDGVEKVGVVVGLTIKNSTFTINNVKVAVFGIIAGTNNGIIANCNLIGTNTINLITNVSSSNLNNKNEIFTYTVGGLVGVNNGSIDYSMVSGELNVTPSFTSYYKATFDGLVNLGLTGVVVNNTTLKYGSLAGINNGVLAYSKVSATIKEEYTYVYNVDGTTFGQAYLNLALYEGALVGVNSSEIIGCESVELLGKNFHDENSEGYNNSHGLSSHLEQISVIDYTVYEYYKNIIGYSNTDLFEDITIITK